ncbi:class II fructose-bisphosphate aldolase [Candidatus Enterococcus ferrettii]|uniref:Fructose-bisphosphate aldolase, class II n=1 Tax=Candidatus Enterococcus ferrettii TaxID=2815324 RepID=A0ABV0EJ80_9ENTE|nr:class II fructose-bisphosphate aldolase [Enterococcus sp. 665A]MBO1339193.1 class II fructose-bisphosphate aldolase [Enterococcus sp. 665A]
MYTSMKAILSEAQRENYAVAAVNCLNLETVRGVVRAAEEERAPIIIQITPRSVERHPGMAYFSSLVRFIAEKASIPVALNYDHGELLEGIIAAINCGFSNIMIDGSALHFEENVRRTQIVAALAHQQGISVEAELGHVGEASNGDNYEQGLLTDVSQAKRFVEATQVDALAIAIGTAHGHYPKDTAPKLDFVRLAEIKEQVTVPLVLHGGSGLDDASLKKAVAYGINKINIYSDLSKTSTDALRDYLLQYSEADMLDTFSHMEQAVVQFAQQAIQLSGSSNRYPFF